MRPPAKPGFQCRGAAQAIGDAGEDDGEIGGAEGPGEQGEARGRGALLNRAGEFLAVIDQFADQAEDAADAAGDVGAGPRWLGVRGWGRSLGCGRHEQNKNTKSESCQGKQSCAEELAVGIMMTQSTVWPAHAGRCYHA